MAYTTGQLSSYFPHDLARKAVLALVGGPASSVAFAAGTNAGTWKTVGTVVHLVGNTFASKAGTDNNAATTGTVLVAGNAINVIPAGYTVALACLMNASGTYSVVAGTPVLTADVTAGNATVRLPDWDPNSYCCVGWIKIAATSAYTLGGGAFPSSTTGTTTWSGTADTGFLPLMAV